MPKYKNKNFSRLNKLIFGQLPTPRCYHCNEAVVRTIDQIDSQATIDHIIPKGDIRRFLMNSREEEDKNTVLSCYKCNQERNDSWQKEMSDCYRSLGSYPINLLDFCITD